MKHEIISFLVRATIAYRNGDGEITEIKGADFPIMQDQYGMSLRDVETKILEQIENPQPCEKESVN